MVICAAADKAGESAVLPHVLVLALRGAARWPTFAALRSVTVGCWVCGAAGELLSFILGKEPALRSSRACDCCVVDACAALRSCGFALWQQLEKQRGEKKMSSVVRGELS